MKLKQRMSKKSVLNRDQTAQADTEASLGMLITTELWGPSSSVTAYSFLIFS